MGQRCKLTILTPTTSSCLGSPTMIRCLQNSGTRTRSQRSASSTKEDQNQQATVELNYLKNNNETLKKMVSRFDISANLDIKKYQKLAQSQQEQIDEQINLIQELQFQIKRMKLNSCKDFDDILVKKKFRSLNEQPTFNVRQSVQRYINERNSATRTLNTPHQSRIHSKTLHVIK